MLFKQGGKCSTSAPNYATWCRKTTEGLGVSNLHSPPLLNSPSAADARIWSSASRGIPEMIRRRVDIHLWKLS